MWFECCEEDCSYNWVDIYVAEDVPMARRMAAEVFAELCDQEDGERRRRRIHVRETGQTDGVYTAIFEVRSSTSYTAKAVGGII